MCWPVLAMTKPDNRVQNLSFVGKAYTSEDDSSKNGWLDVRSRSVNEKDPLTSPVSGSMVSGQEDSNLRPHGPEPCALAKLSYAPNCRFLPISGPKRLL